jgi:hypothetical protein
MFVQRGRLLAAVMATLLVAALGCGDWVVLGRGHEEGVPCCELDTAEARAEREDYLEWCPEACAEAYRQGWMQGLACASEESEYAASVATYRYEALTEISCCDERIVPGISCEGASHFDGLPTAFDYGYFDGWTAAGCGGEPVGTDMDDLTWPDRDPDDDTPGPYQPGWYPCPDPA